MSALDERLRKMEERRRNQERRLAYEHKRQRWALDASVDEFLEWMEHRQAHCILTRLQGG